MSKVDMNKCIDDIFEIAEIYNKYLLGNTFLLINESGDITELFFGKKDFLHLTGVATKLYADDFHKYVKNKKLKSTQIFFNSRYPYALHKKKILCMKKLHHLFDGSHNNLRGLYQVHREKISFPFAVANSEMSLCFRKVENKTYYQPQSIRKEKINRYNANKRIIFIAQKDITYKHYKNVMFGKIEVISQMITKENLLLLFNIKEETSKSSSTL